MEKEKISAILGKVLQGKILLSFVVLLFVLKVVAVVMPINFPYNIFFADITKSSLENLVNQTRQSLGLQPLTENEKLNQAAQLKAEHMVQEQYFSHTSPTGVTPWFWFLKSGYNYKYAGENLAVGFFESEEVFNAWINSPSHKANIVNPNYKEMGTAILTGYGLGNAIVVVQEFGSVMPAKQAAPIKENLQPLDLRPETQVNVEPESEPLEPAEIPEGERVLSQETESQNFFGAPAGNTSENLTSKLLNFVIYDYDKLLQNAIYGVALIVIGILITLILFNFNAGLNRELVFRTVLIVILLSLAAAFNKELIISLIPHQIII